jgi:hypothetical protein
MTPTERDDLLQQKGHFDADRGEIEKRYPSRVVGFVAGRLQVAETVQELFQAAQASHPGRMVYFEPIAFAVA